MVVVVGAGSIHVDLMWTKAVLGLPNEVAASVPPVCEG